MGRENSIRENNFNILRVIAALMVMSGHMAYIDGSNNLPLLWEQGIQTIGVKIFFLLGGYLITKSWLSDPKVIRYAIKRIMRIFPALISYVLLATLLVGPIISKLSFEEYFANGNWVHYLNNILLFPVYGLPGVFSDNPYPNAVNGSLWTLPVEVFMYLVVPIIFLLVGKKKNLMSKVALCIMALAVCVFQILHLALFPEWSYVIYGTDIASAFTLIPYYFIGMVVAYTDFFKILNLQVAVVIAGVFSCLKVDYVLNEVIMMLVLPYLVFSFALEKNAKFKFFLNKHEISYGIYLYGFFIQQIVVYYFHTNGWGNALSTAQYFILSVLFTCVVAFGSFVIVERPMQRLSKKILLKIKC